MWHKIPNWESFKSLGRSKVIKSSYWWLFIVPMLAKLFEATGDEIVVTIFNATFRMTLNLPFSWSLFYFSAVCFSFASITYLFKCPKSIDKYDSFEAWEKLGRDPTALIRSFLASYRDDKGMEPHIITDKTKNYFLKHYLEYKGDVDKVTKEPRTPLALIKAGIPEGNIKGVYYYVFDTVKFVSVKARLIMLISYTLGFLCFGAVLIQNFIYVCKHL
ncbi:hypothetical protein [Colwellia sp. TT2012]|uniref:hypothetical protein n=1 Tax=Colwellia sp. TT2012 TaxID=1720342 RepID=UPI00071026F0|nr:hypothetical protein [Colwellia sp. TT2012]